MALGIQRRKSWSSCRVFREEANLSWAYKNTEEEESREGVPGHPQEGVWVEAWGWRNRVCV